MVSLIIWLCPCQRIDYIQLFYVVNRIELREAIKDTKQEIEAVKFQLEQSQDNKEILDILPRLKAWDSGVKQRQPFLPKALHLLTQWKMPLPQEYLWRHFYHDHVLCRKHMSIRDLIKLGVYLHGRKHGKS